MNNPKFKKGDWCFCEFELKQVIETSDNRITEVSSGYSRLSSRDLSDRCFPLTLRIKVISDSVNYWSRKFHETNCNNLNHPDLNRELIKRWVSICETSDDDDLTNKKIKSLEEFGKSVINKVDNLRCEQVEGVRIFGR
jgi:hypothetical protein